MSEGDAVRRRYESGKLISHTMGMLVDVFLMT